MSESQTFEDKLSILDRQVFANYKLQRLSVFTLLDEDLLERFYSRNVPEFPVRASIPLASTFFGEALATHRPAILKRKGDNWPYDLPELEIEENREFLQADRSEEDPEIPGIKKIQKGRKTEEVYVLLPLVEADRTRGLLVATFPAKTEISDADQKLLESLIPFVSTSFQYEKNRSHLLVAEKNIRISDEIQDYLHHRYLESSRGIHRLLDQKPEGLPDELFVDIKSVSRSILPPLVDRSQNLPAKLKEYIEGFQTRAEENGMEFEMDWSDNAAKNVKARIGDRFRNLFWLVTEAIDNAIKHSDARWVQIRLIEKENTISLTVTDNGEGLIRKAGSIQPENGKGLHAIRTIAQSLLANLEIAKGPRGYGTAIVLNWDLAQLERNAAEAIQQEA